MSAVAFAVNLSVTMAMHIIDVETPLNVVLNLYTK